MSQQINLYEERLRPQYALLTGRRLAVMLGAVLALVVALVFFMRWQADQAGAEARKLQTEVATLQEKHSALTRVLAERKISPALQADLDNARVMLSVRKEIVDLLDSGRLGNNSGFSAVFHGFSRQTSADLWLSGFSVTTGGHDIEIRGKLLDAAKLPGYMQRLALDPAFQGRKFAALTMSQIDPVDAKPETPVAPQAAVAAAPLRLPRHVEFVLRSENAGDDGAGGRK